MASFEPFLGQFSRLSAIFPLFPGGAKSHFSAIFFPFRAGGPIWGLYRAIGIASFDAKLGIKTSVGSQLCFWHLVLVLPVLPFLVLGNFPCEELLVF